ncbi:MAG TPA: histidinol-phosphate transaminase [Silvibacterium sp.]|jgi:histidinol-phosphate aminotransferase|nr:histidinol-phosphate transaminase [Silvibacterium sp.]
MTDVTTRAPQPRELIRRMKEYHPPLGDRTGLRLDFNENTVACSPRVLEVLAQISPSELTMYPERERVESLVAEHLNLKPSQVLLTNGVDEAIHVLCQTYLGPGDEMLLPVPTYSMYAVYASATEAKLVEVQAGADFRFPLDALLKAATPATKVIAIANPNSPTGQPVCREAILKIIDAAPHAMIFIDEAYFHFYGHTVLDLIGQAPNVIVARTFSKAYGLAGLRLGLLVADEEPMRWLRRVISPYSVNSLALACLPAALDDDAYVDAYMKEILTARSEFAAALEGMGVRHWPSEANFILAYIGLLHAEFLRAMRARGVLVRDRSADPGCHGCVRITIGTRQQMQRAVLAMVESLREIEWTGETA